MTEQRFEGREPLGPEAFVGAEPAVCLRERLRIELAEVRPSAHGASNEAGLLEGLHVLRRGGQRHAERRGEFAHGMFPLGEATEHGAPRGVAEGPEHAIELLRMCNHVVEYSGVVWLVNHMVE